MSGRPCRYSRSSVTTRPRSHQWPRGRRMVSMFRRGAALVCPPISRMPCVSHGSGPDLFTDLQSQSL